MKKPKHIEYYEKYKKEKGKIKKGKKLEVEDVTEVLNHITTNYGSLSALQRIDINNLMLLENKTAE